ncbi:MAG: D-sedoheptulose 7-phosphate isomerase [Rhodanobacteraceae bacterium]|nr:MAG: D-sedoheptulose 7-phosphate isomerase [Rhodanobacteraceae bacterium]
MNNYIDREFEKSRRLVEAMAADAALRQQVLDVVAHAVKVLQRGNKILFAGNGGSAADAQHWAAELVSRFNYDRPGLPGIALTTDTSALTAIGNDYGYERVFARQIEALGRRGDLLFALSTSGNSKNILLAIDAARTAGIDVIGFTGRSGGAMAGRCTVCLNMPSDETPKIQEGHELLGHLICGMIEREMFPRGRA